MLWCLPAVLLLQDSLITFHTPGSQLFPEGDTTNRSTFGQHELFLVLSAWCITPWGPLFVLGRYWIVSLLEKEVCIYIFLFLVKSWLFIKYYNMGCMQIQYSCVWCKVQIAGQESEAAWLLPGTGNLSLLLHVKSPSSLLTARLHIQTCLVHPVSCTCSSHLSADAVLACPQLLCMSEQWLCLKCALTFGFLFSSFQTVELVDQLLRKVDPAKDRELWVKEHKTGDIRPVDMEI